MTTNVLTFKAECFADLHQEIETDSDQAAITADEKISSEMGNQWLLGLVNFKRGGNALVLVVNRDWANMVWQQRRLGCQSN